jgi:hypothetical protein
VGDVAGGDLGDGQALADLGADLGLDDQSAQLGLGLRAGQTGALAALALGAASPPELGGATARLPHRP